MMNPIQLLHVWIGSCCIYKTSAKRNEIIKGRTDKVGDHGFAELEQGRMI